MERTPQPTPCGSTWSVSPRKITSLKLSFCSRLPDTQGFKTQSKVYGHGQDMPLARGPQLPLVHVHMTPDGQNDRRRARYSCRPKALHLSRAALGREVRSGVRAWALGPTAWSESQPTAASDLACEMRLTVALITGYKDHTD